MLNCTVHGGAGFIFGSSKDLDCTFKGINGGVDRYYGSISKFGIDLGFTDKSKIIWTVFAPSADLSAGALAGKYVVSAFEGTVGLVFASIAPLRGLPCSIPV